MEQNTRIQNCVFYTVLQFTIIFEGNSVLVTQSDPDLHLDINMDSYPDLDLDPDPPLTFIRIQLQKLICIDWDPDTNIDIDKDPDPKIDINWDSDLAIYTAMLKGHITCTNPRAEAL